MDTCKVQKRLTRREAMPQFHLTEEPQSLASHRPGALKERVAACQWITDTSDVFLAT